MSRRRAVDQGPAPEELEDQPTPRVRAAGTSDRRARDLNQPKPAGRGASLGKEQDPGHRPPTPEELERAQELHDAGLVRMASKNEGNAQYAADRVGQPCACGTDDDPRPCLAHYALTGRRRHVRPK